MSNFNQRSKIRKQKLKEQNIEAQNEKRRLKALPKTLRKLESELCYHVDFMEVYDGYLGDFTGEVVPVEPVKNPFSVIRDMELNFPHPNALSEVQKQEYINNIKKAFNSLGFFIEDATPFECVSPLNYTQLFNFIENPPKVDYWHITTLKTDDISITIERFDYDHF
ncbi:MAG: hypothetical protein PF486_14330 [Prolixibacteraceae bacterium]|jgi:hypothetical protein|nr:hypothetical protein [Prolixibacteraceae bacterium]